MPLSTSNRISEPLYLDLPDTPTKMDTAFSFERAKMFQELGIFYENLLKTAQPMTPASPFDQQNMFTYGPFTQTKPRNPFSIESILGFQAQPTQTVAASMQPQQYSPESLYSTSLMGFSSPPRHFESNNRQSTHTRNSFMPTTPQSVCSSYSSPASSSSASSSPIKSQDETHRNTKVSMKKTKKQNEQMKTKGKRIRTIFTAEQLERLENEFERQQYMVGSGRNYLAATLNLTEAQVKVWFQNRRIKWRKQHLEGVGAEEEILQI